jgi:hypothetical protein
MQPMGDSRLAAAVTRLLKRSTTLDDGEVRVLWADLTGERPAGHRDQEISPADWWAKWKVGRKLRDEVAHQGAAVSQEQAAEAVEFRAPLLRHEPPSTAGLAPSRLRPGLLPAPPH